jgi:hypothetical protein
MRMMKYRKFFKENLTLSQDKLISPNLNDSLEFIRRQNYDAIYVGSDTLLELKRARKDELTAYWLNNGLKTRKFLLAASSHNVTFEALSDHQREQMQQTIADFSLLGVRDEATFRLLSHFTRPDDERLRIIPDPTFTYEIDYSHIERYFKRRNLSFDKPVVCLHLLRDSQWGSTLAAYFRKEGYIIASLRPAYYADVILTDLSPFEQMGVYRYFQLVITHRFHDAIFCLKNLTPVIVFPEQATDVTPFGESKHQSLLRAFKVESTHYVPNTEALTAEYLFDIHLDAIRAFKDNEAVITSVLREHKNKYESFLMRSSTLIQ